MSATRQGTVYKTVRMTDQRETMGAAPQGGDGFLMLMQEMVRDRQQREEQLAEERRLRAEEQRLRAEQQEEERHMREEADARRDQETQQQLTILRGLVEGMHRQSKAAIAKADREVKMTRLTESDDIEAYLTTFERLMRSYDVPPDRWAHKLAPQLIGKAQQANVAMPPREAGDYDHLKQAILCRYDIDGESYRRRFRSAVRDAGETNRELAVRLDDLAGKWMKGCTTVEEVRDLVVREQILNTLPEHIRIWVKEHKPATSMEAAQLADDYVQAQRQDQDVATRMRSVRCHKCQQMGHMARDCAVTVKGESVEGGAKPAEATPLGGKRGKGRNLQQVECFNCCQKGHLSHRMPSSAWRGEWTTRVCRS